jgi:hypothetical protein
MPHRCVVHVVHEMMHQWCTKRDLSTSISVHQSRYGMSVHRRCTRVTRPRMRTSQMWRRQSKNAHVRTVRLSASGRNGTSIPPTTLGHRIDRQRDRADAASSGNRAQPSPKVRDFLERRNHREFTGKPGAPAFLARASGSEGTFVGENAYGEKVLVGYTRSGLANWLVGANIKRSVIEAPLTEAL